MTFDDKGLPTVHLYGFACAQHPTVKKWDLNFVFDESCQKMARRNSGEISRNSGVISRNSGVIVWTESSAGFDFEKLFQLRVLTGTMSSATLLGGPS